MKLGDKRTEEVHFGDAGTKTMTGLVVYIHPRRMFYVVEFEIEGYRLRESYYFPGRAGERC